LSGKESHILEETTLDLVLLKEGVVNIHYGVINFLTEIELIFNEVFSLVQIDESDLSNIYQWIM